MMSQAAIDGISENGFRWRHRLSLRPMTTRLAALNERDGGTREEREPLVEKIVAIVRQFAKDNSLSNERMASDLIMRADELACLADCDLEDINHGMNDLYDSFDFWRVLAA